MDPVQPFFFLSEPRGKVWRDVLNAAADLCSTGLVVVRPEAPLDAEGARCAAALAAFGVSAPPGAWPGEALRTGEILRFALGPETFALLAAASDGPFEWIQPDLPEDLCLLRPDGAPWLVVLAHARDASLILTLPERASLVRRFPRLNPILS